MQMARDAGGSPLLVGDHVFVASHLRQRLLRFASELPAFRDSVAQASLFLRQPSHSSPKLSSVLQSEELFHRGQDSLALSLDATVPVRSVQVLSCSIEHDPSFSEYVGDFIC
jgi:hypothetical protein